MSRPVRSSSVAPATGCSLVALERYLATLEAVLTDPRWDGTGIPGSPDLAVLPPPAAAEQRQADALLARITMLQQVLAGRMATIRRELDAAGPRRQAARSYARQDRVAEA